MFASRNDLIDLLFYFMGLGLILFYSVSSLQVLVGSVGHPSIWSGMPSLSKSDGVHVLVGSFGHVSALSGMPSLSKSGGGKLEFGSNGHRSLSSGIPSPSESIGGGTLIQNGGWLGFPAVLAHALASARSFGEGAFALFPPLGMPPLIAKTVDAVGFVTDAIRRTARRSIEKWVQSSIFLIITLWIFKKFTFFWKKLPFLSEFWYPADCEPYTVTDTSKEQYPSHLHLVTR
jgi:hypothetical protein